MARTIVSAVIFFALCVVSYGQYTAYYKAIQKKASEPLRPEQFKKLEESALKNYSQPESYDALARAFGNTTEKVWAVIYGEVYCNLSPDPDQSKAVGSLVFQWYESSLSKNGNNFSVSLTENAQGAVNQVPFESLFEQAFLMGAIPVSNSIPPLSIAKLTSIRKSQLSLWIQRKLPKTELLRREEAILSAGHFEAYNYWLFQSARPDDFNTWLADHKPQLQAWLDWQSQNKFAIQTPDFQRLYLIHKR